MVCNTNKKKKKTKTKTKNKKTKQDKNIFGFSKLLLFKIKKHIWW